MKIEKLKRARHQLILNKKENYIFSVDNNLSFEFDFRNKKKTHSILNVGTSFYQHTEWGKTAKEMKWRENPPVSK